MNTVQSPESFFGFTLGADCKIARWDKIIEYYNHLASKSDKIQVSEIGKSTEGNPFLKIIITSPSNFANLDEIRANNAKIADPRGLSDVEIKSLVALGKAVSVQSMSLHASEIGGTQMAPQLAYDLITSQSEETLRILENVVFVMVPCFNPDGQIMVTDWYNETLGTPFEGCNYPSLYHKYTGHDNNRDAFMHNIIESKYMGDILFKEWTPQSYFDHHHMGSYGARIFVPPYKNPVRPYTDPLVWNELSLYGANMCYRMEQENLSGASTASQFPGWGHYGYHWITNSHNIAGMLSECANAKLASPLYIHRTQLEGNGDKTNPFYGQHNNFTNPWEGGWWRLGDIVRRQYVAAYTVLDTMAKNREQILYNMTQKALRQTQRGMDSAEKSFIISADQYDKGTARKLIQILLNQGIELHFAEEDFVANSVLYLASSVVVPLNQPKMGVIMNLLAQTRYPDNFWTRDLKGSFTAFDTASDTVAEYMGVKVVAANCVPTGKFVQLKELAAHEPANLPKAGGYVISAKENSSYRTVNKLLAAGFAVSRIDVCPYRDFYVEGDYAKLCEIFNQTQAVVRAIDAPHPQMTPVKPLKIAIYQRYYTGNADEGWTRLLMDNMEYSYETVMDADIFDGKLASFDALILPDDDYMMLYGMKHYKNHPKYAGMMQYVGAQPPEKESGLGNEGSRAIADFVNNGGRLLAFSAACGFAAKACELKVSNLAESLPQSAFNTHGSTLNIDVDTQDPICYGMPKQALALHWSGPVLQIDEKFNAGDFKIGATYAKTNVLQSGLLTGEALIASTPALVTAKRGKGEVILYSFAPQHRAQTHGTFKMVFNALYK